MQMTHMLSRTGELEAERKQAKIIPVNCKLLIDANSARNPKWSKTIPEAKLPSVVPKAKRIDSVPERRVSLTFKLFK